MMTFNGFNKKCRLKNKETSTEEIIRNLSSLTLNDIRIYLRDGPFKTEKGVVNLHPSNGTH